MPWNKKVTQPVPAVHTVICTGGVQIEENAFSEVTLGHSRDGLCHILEAGLRGDFGL